MQILHGQWFKKTKNNKLIGKNVALTLLCIHCKPLFGANLALAQQQDRKAGSRETRAWQSEHRFPIQIICCRSTSNIII
jgi:hypothetical protein